MMLNKILHVITFSFRHIRDLPITIYFNLRVLPYGQAWKLPIWIAHGTKLRGVRRNIIKINGHCTMGMIQYGLWGIQGVSTPRRAFLGFGQEKENKIIFNGTARFGTGTYITVDKGATVEVGGNFVGNNNLMIRAHKKVIFGENNLIGWNVRIMDSDNHKLIVNEKEKNENEMIEIGNNVWIASEVSVLKGACISDGSVVGYGSLVLNKFENNNVLIAGSPARKLVEDVVWEY